MYHDRKKSAVAELHPSGPGIVGRGWARERLLRVRDLIFRALELIEASGGASEAAAELRVSLVRINAELAARGGKSRG